MLVHHEEIGVIDADCSNAECQEHENGGHDWPRGEAPGESAGLLKRRSAERGQGDQEREEGGWGIVELKQAEEDADGARVVVARAQAQDGC